MTDDLVAFLRACLDEDEQTALEAMHRPRSSPPDIGHWGYVHEDLVDGDGLVLAPKVWIPSAVHIARWDPVRVLAEVQAKRRIIDLHEGDVKEYPVRFDPLSGERIGPEYEVTCDVCGWASLDPSSACETLRLLALPYAGHDAYRAEWAPDTEVNHG